MRIEMMRLMRPVVDFLNKLKDEVAERERSDAKQGPLELLLQNSKPIALPKVQLRSTFSFPTATKATKKVDMQRICFERRRDEVALVKKSLGETNASEIGGLLFDYYYNAEIVGDEN